VAENGGHRGDYSKQRDPQSRRPFSVWLQCGKRHHKVTSVDRADRSATRASRSQDKFTKHLWHNAIRSWKAQMSYCKTLSNFWCLKNTQRASAASK